MSINNLRATIVHFTWDFIRHPQKHRGGKQMRGGTGRRKREREKCCISSPRLTTRDNGEQMKTKMENRFRMRWNDYSSLKKQTKAPQSISYFCIY